MQRSRANVLNRASTEREREFSSERWVAVFWGGDAEHCEKTGMLMRRTAAL